jgi:hypothetical protein
VKIEYHEDHKDFKDHVHITYDPDRITPKKMVEVIREVGLPATVIRDRPLEGSGD